MAAPQADLKPSIPGPGSLYQDYLAVNSTMVGVIFLITGLLLLALGRVIFRISLALVGGYLFAWFGFLLLTFLNASHDVNVTVGMYWGICLCFALVGALIAYFLYKVGLFFGGGVLGFFMATWILSLGARGVIPSDSGRRAFVYVFAVLMAILVLLFEKMFLNVLLPIVGAYLTFLGIDVFAKTGFSMVFTMVVSAYSSADIIYRPDGHTYGMIAGFVVTAVLGVFVNFRRGKK